MKTSVLLLLTLLLTISSFGLAVAEDSATLYIDINKKINKLTISAEDMKRIKADWQYLSCAAVLKDKGWKRKFGAEEAYFRFELFYHSNEEDPSQNYWTTSSLILVGEDKTSESSSYVKSLKQVGTGTESSLDGYSDTPNFRVFGEEFFSMFKAGYSEAPVTESIILKKGAPSIDTSENFACAVVIDK